MTTAVTNTVSGLRLFGVFAGWENMQSKIASLMGGLEGKPFTARLTNKLAFDTPQERRIV